MTDILRAVASSLQIPTIIILLSLIGISVFMLGALIVEVFTERRRYKQSIPKLIDEIQVLVYENFVRTNPEDLLAVIKKTKLLKRQKKAIEELINRGNLTGNTRDALARQLIFEEQNYYERKTKVTDIVARIAPIFGLMGTLIPLGPGLIALGQGDTKTLSESLLIAFDTTVAGLVSGAAAFLISSIRKRWYEEYVVSLETIMETILEAQSK
ncbi:MAG: MotA/TolQ/ExbB proton channel family protein [Anaerovoracaceae bacterium]